MTQNQILQKLSFSKVELEKRGKELTRDYKEGKTKIGYSDKLTQEAYLYKYAEKYNFGSIDGEFEKVALFGCGPCVENFRFEGTDKFVIVDRYAKSWSKTRNLILPDEKVSQILELDFTQLMEPNKELESCECFYFQNCLNEIVENQLYGLLKNIEYLNQFGEIRFVDFAEYGIIPKIFNLLKQNYYDYKYKEFEKDGTKFASLDINSESIKKCPKYNMGKVEDVLDFEKLNDFDDYLIVNDSEFVQDCEKYGPNICKVNKKQTVERDWQNKDFVVFGKAKPKFTSEQQKVIDFDSTQNLIVNAVAGSGKTTTLIEMANNLAQKDNKKVLFTSFSREIVSEINRKLMTNNFENSVEIVKQLIFEQTKYFSSQSARQEGEEYKYKKASEYKNNQNLKTRIITCRELNIIEKYYSNYEHRFVNKFLYYYFADKNLDAIKLDGFMQKFWIGTDFIEDFENRLCSLEPKNTQNKGVSARGMHSMGLNMWLKHLNRNGEKFVHSSVDTKQSGLKKLNSKEDKYSKEIYKGGFFTKLKWQVLKESDILSEQNYHYLSEILGEDELQDYLLSSEKDFDTAQFEQILSDKLRLSSGDVREKLDLIQAQVSNAEEKLDSIQNKISKNRRELRIYKENYEKLIPEDIARFEKLSKKIEELDDERDLIIEEYDEALEVQDEVNTRKENIASDQKILSNFTYDSRKFLLVQTESWRNIAIELISKLRLCSPVETKIYTQNSFSDIENILPIAKKLIGRFQLDADLVDLSEDILGDLVLPRIHIALSEGYCNGLEGFLDFDDMLWLPFYSELENKYKYDIALVDEAQDMNELMYLFTTNCMSPNTQTVLVGDDKQAIYGFAGSTSGALKEYKTRLNATELPMTTCFRCPPNVLTQVNSQFKTDLKPAKTKQNGIIDNGFSTLTRNTEALILSRFNLPLYSHALSLRNQNFVVSIEKNNQILEIYKDIKKNFENDILKGINMARDRIVLSVDKKIKKIYANKKVGAMTKEAHRRFLIAKQIDDLEVLDLVWNDYQKSLDRVVKKFEDFYSDFVGKNKKATIHLMSMHKSKGLEAENVYILGTKLVGKKAIFQDIEAIEIGDIPMPFDRVAEENLKYVALTRTKQNLYFIPNQN